MTPPTAWLATFVTRWHSGDSAPWLAHTRDYIGGHQGRMGVLALTVWPDCTRELLVACLCHDLGEYGACDAPSHAKADATLRGAVERLEDAALARMGLSFGLSADDTAKLKFLDRWDAYLWASHHAPHIMGRDDWQSDRRGLYAMAGALGVTRNMEGAK